MEREAASKKKKREEKGISETSIEANFRRWLCRFGHASFHLWNDSFHDTLCTGPCPFSFSIPRFEAAKLLFDLTALIFL